MDAATVGEADIRRARRAYYGAISYVDEHVGRLTRALELSGLAQDTIVIVTSDHGEMLGERGFWYKMSFFEGSARVPLIMHAPRRFAARRVESAVSLLDILPTLVEIGHDGGRHEYAGEIDGRSLMPHLAGDGGHDEAFGEYLAEGAIAPIVMIRRGAHKFVLSPADPDQLYNLVADPDELENLAELGEHAALRASFRAEIARRWDLASLDGAVRESQRRRHMVSSALSLGKLSAWDYQPPRDASREYIRNHMDLDDLEARARFPSVVRKPS
jgi:choline-sulfatase